MVKKNGKLQPATWDEALDTLAEKLKPLAGKDGDGIAALASTRLPVEALSLFKQVFADCMSSEMVTSLEEGQTTVVASGLAEELGRPFEANLDALKAADCVLAIGVDLAESHMVAGFLVKRNLPGGTRLVVIDPGQNGLDPHANVILKATKGADLDILKGIQAGLVKLGLYDGGLAGKTPAEAEKELANAAQATGISADDLLAAAGMLGVAEKPVIVYGKGITAKSAVQTLRQIIELGQQSGAALLSIKGQANSLAAAQYRLERPFQLNGHQAVFVALGDDTLSQRMEQRLEKAPFLAVQASYISRLTATADVVLPVEMWAEQEGHYLNLEGRLQQASRALTAPDGVRSNADALKALAGKLGMQPDENWQASVCARPAPVEIAA